MLFSNLMIVSVLLVAPSQCDRINSLTLFWNLYDAVIQGTRILNDVADGVGAVTKAIDAIDDLFDFGSNGESEKLRTQKPPSLQTATTVKQSEEESLPVAPADDSRSSKVSTAAESQRSEELLVAGPHTSKKTMATESQTPKVTVTGPQSSRKTVVAASRSTKETTVAGAQNSKKKMTTESQSSKETIKAKPQSSLVSTVAGSENSDVPAFTGCGALGFHIKGENLPVSHLMGCCSFHEACYGSSCNSVKRDCDSKLRDCLFSICERKDVIEKSFQNNCRSAAKLLFSGTMALSFQQYGDAQARINCHTKKKKKTSKSMK